MFEDGRDDTVAGRGGRMELTSLGLVTKSGSVKPFQGNVQKGPGISVPLFTPQLNEIQVDQTLPRKPGQAGEQRGEDVVDERLKVSITYHI